MTDALGNDDGKGRCSISQRLPIRSRLSPREDEIVSAHPRVASTIRLTPDLERRAKRSRAQAAAAASGSGSAMRVATLAGTAYRHLELYFGSSRGWARSVTPQSAPLPDQALLHRPTIAEDRWVCLDLHLPCRCREAEPPSLSRLRPLRHHDRPRRICRRQLWPNVLCYEELIGQARARRYDSAGRTFDENMLVRLLLHNRGPTAIPRARVLALRSTVLHAFEACPRAPDGEAILGMAIRSARSWCRCSMPTHAWGDAYAAGE